MCWRQRTCPAPVEECRLPSPILRLVSIMRLRWHFVLCLALAVPGGAQILTRQNLAEILGFENGQPGVYPAGWGGGPADTIFTDDQVVHSGKYAARIERSGSSSA